MSLAPNRGILTLIWIIILVFGAVQKPISAQEGGQVHLAPVDTQEFPVISSYLDVRSPEGDFLHGLEKQNVHMIENESRIPVQELQHLNTGVQFVLAVSPGPAFEIRDVQGISRYEYLAESLQGWAGARQGSTVDDLSLIVSDGPEATHLTDSERWANSFKTFKPTGEETGPDFDVLTRALDIAADPTSAPGMSGVVLFITPLPDQDVSVGLQSLAARAVQQGVTIYIWLVASSELFSSPEAEQMRRLAQDTGGDLFAYSGQEAIPSPEEFLDELRDTYIVAYESRITSSGLHQTSAEVNYQGQLMTSPVQEFELEILPPGIAFISPPMEIERSPIDPEGDPQILDPSSQSFELLIEFPDGKDRPINQTRLFVNGVLSQENSGEPFDYFEWDISQLSADGEHTLIAEVEDSLGLVGRSVETSILIKVSGTEENFLGVISQNRVMLAVVVAAVLGAMLLLVLILKGRLQPGILLARRRKKKKNGAVTQPLQGEGGESPQTQSSWINRFHLRRGPTTTKPSAQFIPLTDSNIEKSQPPMAVTKSQLIIGRDENQVDQVLPDASVEEVHARLNREPDGSYRLSDQGSVAGTWVNYRPVPEAGQMLEHGDLVHFGRMGFRFVLRNPTRVRKPVVRFEESL